MSAKMKVEKSLISQRGSCKITTVFLLLLDKSDVTRHAKKPSIHHVTDCLLLKNHVENARRTTFPKYSQFYSSDNNPQHSPQLDRFY